MIDLKNPYLETCEDFWYHIGIGPTEDVRKMFQDVKFVCLGGKEKRMKGFAEFLYETLGEPENSVMEEGTKQLLNISAHAGRYCLYKVGNCISASHGMGMPSMSILLHELFKLLQFSSCEDVSFIRLGTSGGLGLEPGTVVVTDQVYDDLLQPFYEQHSCGKAFKFESKCDKELSGNIYEFGKNLGLKIQKGNTMSCDGFYEEQGRLDGAVCSYEKKEKFEFLNKAHHECGILNVEMEALLFSAYCSRYGVKCAVVCVTMLDRLLGDVVTGKNNKIFEFYPQAVVAGFIKSSLENSS